MSKVDVFAKPGTFAAGWNDRLAWVIAPSTPTDDYSLGWKAAAKAFGRATPPDSQYFNRR